MKQRECFDGTDVFRSIQNPAEPAVGAELAPPIHHDIKFSLVGICDGDGDPI